MCVNFEAMPSRSLQGVLKVPGDKSISHRSIMLGSLASGESFINGILEGEDVIATINAFKSMGVSITKNLNNGIFNIKGVGLHGLKKPKNDLYLGNSGTSMRLLTGIMAGQKFDTELTGDSSLSVRPMKRIVDPLSLMGADITTASKGYAPIKIKGNNVLSGIDYKLPISSAQIKSCIMLAGLYAKSKTTIFEKQKSRDHTERMLKSFGYPIQKKGNQIILEGGRILKPISIDVPADISSAAFFMVAATIVPNSEITLQGTGINPTRNGVIKILKLMGADISLKNKKMLGSEPVADIHVKYSPLKGIDIPPSLVPIAIDEFPVIFVAASCAKGITKLTGASELRVKESDRIKTMSDGLLKIGIKNHPLVDGIIINGGKIKAGTVDSMGDHRISMAFAVAGMCSSSKIIVKKCDNVITSFPNFVELSKSIGMNIKQKIINEQVIF